MNKLTHDDALQMFYRTAYDFLRARPKFDGRQHADHPGMLRRGVDASTIKPWPGAADVQRLSRDEWVEARLDAVRNGDEAPPLKSRGGGESHR